MTKPRSGPPARSGESFTIHVPATSANLGPGFDSVGLALGFGLTARVWVGRDQPRLPAGEGAGDVASASPAPGDDLRGWRVEPESEHLFALPRDESNLIVRAALDVAGDRGVWLPPCRLAVRSEIPLARGLGSSASAIVAGVALANEVGGLGLTWEEMVAAASALEGHPDNVAPAILGGLVVAATVAEGSVPETTPRSRVALIRAALPPADIIVVIPDHEFSTAVGRAALPGSLPHKTAVAASAWSNVLVAALLTGDWPTAGLAMQGDLLHEPYRAPLLPTFSRVRDLALQAGAYGAALSGSGPAVIAFAPPGQGSRVSRVLDRAFPAYDTRITGEDRLGLVITRPDRATP